MHIQTFCEVFCEYAFEGFTLLSIVMTPYTAHMKKTLLIIGTIILLLIIGFYALNTYIYNEKQGENSASQSADSGSADGVIDGRAASSGDVRSYRGTLTGEQVCLPHTDTSGPQTMECALGIKTDAGEYYALDLQMLSQPAPDLATGDRFTATGLITPVEMLSSDHWRKYPIKGIFSVLDSVQKL